MFTLSQHKLIITFFLDLPLSFVSFVSFGSLVSFSSFVSLFMLAFNCKIQINEIFFHRKQKVLFWQDLDTFPFSKWGKIQTGSLVCSQLQNLIKTAPRDSEQNSNCFQINLHNSPPIRTANSLWITIMQLYTRYLPNFKNPPRFPQS